MKKEKQTPKQTKKDVGLTPTTKQDMMDGFNVLKESITKKLNEFAYKQDDPEVKRLYVTYRQAIENWMNLAEIRVADCPVFSYLPLIYGTAPYADLIDLMKYCEKAARADDTTGQNGGGKVDLPNEKSAETEQEKEAINKPNSKDRKIFGDKFELWGFSINYKNLWHKVKNWFYK